MTSSPRSLSIRPAWSATRASRPTFGPPACSSTPSRPPAASGSSRQRERGAPIAAETRAPAELRAGDTLVVWKLDRLGRLLRHLLEMSETLRDRVALRSLTEHIDTATAAGKMLYAILGAAAQFERDVLRETDGAGMRAAQSRGEHIGRPLALTPPQVREARKMLDQGESPSHVARVMRVGRSTLYRAIRGSAP